jgi:hypothetical protein
MEIWPDWDGPGLKCPYGGSDRLWTVPAADANEEFCSQKCLDDAACVTYTALWGSWCIGCSVVPTEAHGATLSGVFKKIVPAGEGNKYSKI